jgi:hypothetical protein
MRQQEDKQRRNAIVTGLVLAAMALAVYAIVVIQYVSRG